MWQRRHSFIHSNWPIKIDLSDPSLQNRRSLKVLKSNSYCAPLRMKKILRQALIIGISIAQDVPATLLWFFFIWIFTVESRARQFTLTPANLQMYVERGQLLGVFVQTNPREHGTSTGGSAVSEMWQKWYPPVFTQQPAPTQVTPGSRSGLGSCLWIAAQHLLLLWIPNHIRCRNISLIFSLIAEWPLVRTLLLLGASVRISHWTSHLKGVMWDFKDRRVYEWMLLQRLSEQMCNCLFMLGQTKTVLSKTKAWPALLRKKRFVDVQNIYMYT